MTLQTEDHVALGIGRLKDCRKGKPVIEGILTSYLEKVQDVEDSVEFCNNLSILNSLGTDLDVFGVFHNIMRQGRGDEEYRAAILAHISAAESDTSPEGIMEACRAYIEDVSDLEYIDLWEYLPNHTDVYMGAGWHADFWTTLKSLAASGTSIRLLFDDRGDSLTLSEGTPTTALLVNESGEYFTLESSVGVFENWAVSPSLEYQATEGANYLFESGYEDNGGLGYSLVTGAYLGDGDPVQDQEFTPAAEAMEAGVRFEVGTLVDESSNPLVDEFGNTLQYTDYRFK